MKISVKMFDDRLIVTSPGAFPPLVTPQNISKAQSARNSFIMSGLKVLKLVKCINEGARRMRDALVESKLPEPEFKEIEDTGAPVTVVWWYDFPKPLQRYI
jgi:ATP-dependent DNA helicase RecG